MKVVNKEPVIEIYANSLKIDIEYEEGVVNRVWGDAIIFSEEGQPTIKIHLGTREKEKVLKILQDFFIRRANEIR